MVEASLTRTVGATHAPKGENCCFDETISFRKEEQ
jgi:hypothetical protein